MRKLTIFFLLSIAFTSYCQSVATISPVGLDGSIIGGYLDQGGYLNFSGPGIQLKINKTRWTLGMLPSLRFKKDDGATQNTLVTPSLGGGLTFSYKWIAFQVPAYYKTKTATTDGKWILGVGIGIKLNELKSSGK